MKSSLPPFWEHFNFSHQYVEKNVSEREGSYKDLSSEALYTSIDDFHQLFQHPLIEGSFCDLGCGTGLAPLLYGYLYPGREASGVEFEEARLKVGQSFQKQFDINNVSLYHRDLLTDQIPKADTYFLYFPTGPVLDRILNNLYHSKNYFCLAVIESHGDLIPRIQLENWLELKDEIQLHSARHYSQIQIYERVDKERDPLLWPFDLSFDEKYLLIEEGGEVSLASTLGIEWLEKTKFNLKFPPRTILLADVKGFLDIDDSTISADIAMAIRLRKSGTVKIQTRSGVFEGYIRKIILRPSFRLEISSGEKVEWRDILTIIQGSQTCYVSS